MTNEERNQVAIDAMNFYKEKMRNGIYGEFVGNFDTAISALEKQIPKKPSETDKARCIHCGCVVKRDERFCKNCGQALDWSDSE